MLQFLELFIFNNNYYYDNDNNDNDNNDNDNNNKWMAFALSLKWSYLNSLPGDVAAGTWRAEGQTNIWRHPSSLHYSLLSHDNDNDNANDLKQRDNK